MLFVIWKIGEKMDNFLIATVVQCLCGVVLYCGGLLIIKDDNFKMILEYIKKLIGIDRIA